MPMFFAFPADGVMLTQAAGQVTGEGLEITCIINAPPDSRITVNGVLCTARTNAYQAAVLICNYKNTLCAHDLDSGESSSIEVFYLKQAFMKYRFSLDDNIWFLQNLARHAGDYRSLFDDPYLSLIKTLHDRHGTKFHLNIYYECPEHGGFNLTQMPDCYKSEWLENASWLRLSCHANANLPDRPYIRASFEQVKFEHDRVVDEILRFAGPEAYAGPVTTIHWGDATVDAVRAMRSSGIRAFVGTFEYANPQNVSIRYYLNAEQCALLNIYGFYYDKQEDVCFFRYGAAIQHEAIERIPAMLDQFAAQHPLYPFIELCVHEQYFYPDYAAYMPDYELRLDTAIRWCAEHGYEPAFISDILLDG